MESKHSCILLPQHLFSEKTVFREGGKGVETKGGEDALTTAWFSPCCSLSADLRTRVLVSSLTGSVILKARYPQTSCWMAIPPHPEKWRSWERTETALVKSCKAAPKNTLHWHGAFWSVRSINWNSQLEQSNSKPAVISVFQKRWGDTCTGNSASYAQHNFIKSSSYFPSLSPNSHLLV